MRAVVTLDRGDDTAGGVTEDRHGLLVRTERARQLLGRGRVCHRPVAQVGNGLQVGRAEPW